MEETAVFRLEPFAQEDWSWREFFGDRLEREYAVDFRTGEAHARKSERDPKEWREQLDLARGTTFAGVGFTTAIRHFRPRLAGGEILELHAIGFTPKPRIVTVRIQYAGVDQMMMSGRRVLGERYVIRPKISAIVSCIVRKPSPSRRRERRAPSCAAPCAASSFRLA